MFFPEPVLNLGRDLPGLCSCLGIFVGGTLQCLHSFLKAAVFKLVIGWPVNWAVCFLFPGNIYTQVRWIPTCDSAHSVLSRCKIPATDTMTWNPTQSHYLDTEQTSLFIVVLCSCHSDLWQCTLMATLQCCHECAPGCQHHYLLSHSVTLLWHWANQSVLPYPSNAEHQARKQQV